MLEKYRKFCQSEYNILKNAYERKEDWFELGPSKDITIHRMCGAGDCLYFLDNKVDKNEVEKIYYEYVEKVRLLG